MWRVEADVLERYIADQYAAARDHIAAHPFVEGDESRDGEDVSADT